MGCARQLALWRLKLRNSVRLEQGNDIEVGAGSRVRHCHIRVRGNGNRLVIERGANLRGVRLEIEGNQCELRIGAGTVIGEGCYLSCREDATRLIIGEDGMLSRNVKVMTGDGHAIFQAGQCINPARSIRIGDHVWLADGVTVLKGVSIGDNAVAGINSLITHEVAAGSIVAGNPALAIRHDVTWSR